MNHVAGVIYAHAPVWVQNAALAVAGYLLDRERRGGRFSEYSELLRRTEWHSRSDLRAYQDERVRLVVKHAYDTVPFYRRRFDEVCLTPADVRGVADLPKVPVLTRSDVRTHYRDLLSTATRGRGLRTGHTSGTTGTPLTVAYDRDSVTMTYAVFDRHYRWAGLRFGRLGDRVAVARGNVVVPLRQKRPPFWRINRTQGQLLLSSFHMSAEHLPAYFEALADFKPLALDGYPSTLYILAKFLQNHRRTFPLRAAITSSETLYGFQRELIEERFECRVFDYYALAERTAFAHECEKHQGHHLAMEYAANEIVDAKHQPVASGVPGRLVGTTLHNLAMPLIRYETTDVTALKSGDCPCGRGLELMEDVTTKAEDILTLPDGRLISPSVLTHPFKPLTCIEGSQIVQTAPEAVTVRIVPGAEYTDAHTRHLVAELRERIGAGVRIDVQMVDALETSANGKFKWVISRVPLGL